MLGTPARFAQFLSSHFPSQEVVDLSIEELKRATFPSDYKGMVAVKSIRVNGMCPHHLLPIEYDIAIGYIPDGRVLGLSKLARLADLYGNMARKQEDVTQSIADQLSELVPNLGVMVIVEGMHSCMTIRGIRAEESKTITSSVTGVYLDPEKQAREEFLALVGRR